MNEQHIVIKQEINGNLESWHTDRYWDGLRFPSRARAVSHGFKAYDHDDFNVGVLRDDRLVWFGWMDKELDRELLPEIAEQIGVKP